MKNFEKAIEKRNKRKNSLLKRIIWYGVKVSGYKAPWWGIPFVGVKHIYDFFNNKRQWNKKKAKKIADRMIFNEIEYDEENNRYIWENHHSYYYAKIPYCYKKWASDFSLMMNSFLMIDYQIKGYTKESEYVEDGFRRYYFTPIEKGE